jgi:hypothetical protein
MAGRRSPPRIRTQFGLSVRYKFDRRSASLRGQHAVEDGPRVAPVLVAVRGIDLPIDLVFGIDEDETHVLVDAAA